jgi:uncharacterized protein (TIGR03437 family)
MRNYSRLPGLAVLNLAAWQAALPQAGVPVLSANGVLNAADYGQAIAPGAMVSIWGTNLAAKTTEAATVPLPTTLDGVTAEIIDSSRTALAPLFFVSERQINAQLPFGISSPSVQVRVRNARGVSNTLTVPVSARAPRLFTLTMDGKGEAIMLHAADYSLVSEAAPAEPGEYLTLLLTGMGAVTPEAQAGYPGGDGGRHGPLNQVSVPVTVTLGGKPAGVLFAGLMPGFAGVYQINVQAPADLPVGRPIVAVSVGSSGSQANVWMAAAPPGKPEDAVKAALEAQARGDIAGMTLHCEMDRFGDAAKRDAVGMLEMLRSYASFSGFVYTHLATAMGDEGTLAVVRAKVSYTIAVRGNTSALAFGVLGIVQKTTRGWKVLSIEPDDLLNQELYEAGRSSQAAAIKTLARTVEPYDIRDLNLRINEALKKSYIDQKKLAADVLFGGIGKVPVYGDGIANIYQVGDTLKSGWETISEFFSRGATPIMTAKAKQVGVGVLQVVTEAVPPLDTYTDMMKATLEQWTYTEEMRRSFMDLKRLLRETALGNIAVTPLLYPLKGFRYNGVEFAVDQTVYHSYERPLAQVALTSPEVLGKQVPFMVVGELEIPANSLVQNAAIMLGGQQRGNMVYVPLDVTPLADGDASTGDKILDGYDRFRRASSASRVVSWEASCRRGVQMLAVHLRNGEATRPLRLLSRFMNAVRDLEITGVSAQGVKLTVGGSATATVKAKAAPFPDTDITNSPECLTTWIADTGVASLDRSKGITLSGVGEGKTTWFVKLGTATNMDGTGEIQKEVPVEVTGFRPVPEPYIRIMFSGIHTYTSSTSKFIELTTASPAGLLWTGASFRASGTIRGRLPTEYKEVSVEGSVNPQTIEMEKIVAKTIETQERSQRRVIEFTIQHMDGSSARYSPAIWRLTGAARIQANMTVKDEIYTWTGTQWRLLSEYKSTAWSDGANPVDVTLQLLK